MSDQGWSATAQLDSGGASADWHRVISFIVALVVFGALTAFHPNWKHNPLQVKWLLAAAFGLVGLFQLMVSSRRERLQLDSIDISALALLGWVAISLAWSPDVWTGFDVLFKWAMLTIAFVGLRRSAFTGTARFSLGLAAAGGLVVTMLIDRLTNIYSGGYYNQNFETEAMLFGMPLLLLLTDERKRHWQQWLAIGVGVVCMLFLLFIVPSKIEFLVWPAMALFFSLALLWRHSRPFALTVGFGVIAATTTIAILGWDRPIFGTASHGFRESVYPRLELALNGLMIWRDAPLLGRGAGFLIVDYPLYQERHLALIGSDFNSGMFTNFFVMAGQLHNDYVQFLAAFGLVGLALLIFAAFAARRQLLRWRESKTRQAGLGIMLACAANALIEFPLQNPTTAMLAVLGLALLIPDDPPTADDTSGLASVSSNRAVATSAWPSRILLAMLLVVTPLTVWWGYRFYIAHDAYSLALRLVPSNPDDKGDVISTLENRITLVHAATRAYPPEELFRNNLYPLLVQLQENTGGRWIQPQIHDQMFATSLTTGLNNILMMFRLEYLLDSGRYRERPEEVAKWRRQLTTNATRIADTWLMEALYCITENKPEAARAAVDRYFKITKGQVEPHRAKMLEEIHGKLPPELRW